MNNISELKSIVYDSIKTTGFADNQHHHHHYCHRRHNDFFGWMFMPTPVHHHHYHGGERNKEETDYFMIGIALGALALVAGCFLGGDIADYSRSSDGIELARRVRNLDIGRDAEGLFKKVQNQAFIRGAIKSAVVASATLGVGGCLVASSPIVTIAAVALFTSSLAFAIHKGATWDFDSQMDRKFQSLYARMA